MKRLVFGLLLASAPAGAALDPDRAQAEVDRAVLHGDDVFCKKPPVPLRGHSRDLCPHAPAISGCEALVTACGDDAPPKSSVPKWLQGLAQILMYALFAAFVVVVGVGIFALARSARTSRRARDGALEEEDSTPRAAETTEDAPSALLARADALRESDPERALALYLKASLLALDVRGAIRVADDRTNGEYLRECGDRSAKAPLRAIVHEVERVRFGNTPPRAAMVERVARAAATIVTAIALLSCDAIGRAGLGPAADPAATTMLTRALVEQGVDVKGAGSLVRLPLPTNVDVPPALLIDLDTVELEDEASAHVRAWAEAGGTLIVAGDDAASFAMTSRTLATTTEVRTPSLAEHAVIRTPEGLAPRGGCVTLATAGETPYALLCTTGRGFVLAMATDDLIANAGFSRGTNAKIAFDILRSVEPWHILLASPADGVSPPDSPLASLTRAGLGPGLWHGLIAALLLFWAVGARLARPKPADPPSRRAFAEHVEATGALYARRKISGHALAALVRFVEDRVRGDVPLSLSHRTGVNVDECEAIWTRARRPAPSEELAALRGLHRLVSRSSSLR